MATLSPGFADFLPAWVATQRWYRGKGGSARPALRLLASLRWEDPLGEVGLEDHIVVDESGPEPVVYQIPLSYRAEAVDFLADALVARLAADPLVAEALAGRYRTMEAWGLHAFVPELLCYLGRALLAQGRGDEARAALDTARRRAEALGARNVLWPILAGLAETAAQAGDGNGADDLRAQAVAILGYIADHAGSDELRASFLAQARVRALLEA